jgi:hypothetical protein
MWNFLSNYANDQKRSNANLLIHFTNCNINFFFYSNRFVNLLEFADDILHCKNVIVYFDKTHANRAALVKTFMFLGFHILSPDNTLMPIDDKQPDQLCMVYNVDIS